MYMYMYMYRYMYMYMYVYVYVYTDPSEVVEDPHRETKYRPGPNPHWPVCH